MTYYEELGLSAKASEAEIRKSHQALRTLAAAKMQRLNEVVETLCDEDRRAIYDLGFAPATDRRIVQPHLELSRLALWAAALPIVALLFYGSWMILPRNLKNLYSPLELTTLTRFSPSPHLDFPLQLPSTLPILRIESARIPKKMDGVWVYVIDPRNQPAVWAYAAEAVELELQERDGLMTGNYRSRYKIPDKPMHQELAFQFSGQTKKTEFAWSAGKLRGQIYLKLHPNDLMEASWEIIDKGSVAGLAAASATLMRRRQ